MSLSADLAHAARALPDMGRVSFARLVAYRAEMAIWVLSALLPLVMLALWNAVAAEGPISGFGQVEIARYFAATLLVRQLTGAWIFWQLNYEIRSGGLSPRLLRPLHPLWHDAVWMLTAMPFRMVVLAPLLAGLLLWKPELWAFPGWDALAMCGVTLLLAWVMSFLIQAIFGMLAFWIDQSDGLFGLWFAVWGLMSGYIAPLAIFPPWLQDIAWWLPFRGMLALPVELLGGFLAPADAWDDLAVQVAWTLALLALTVVVWRRGIVRYGAFGA